MTNVLRFLQFAKHPNVLNERHLSILLVFTTIIPPSAIYYRSSTTILQTNGDPSLKPNTLAQRYVKSRETEISNVPSSLSYHEKALVPPQNLKDFFLRFQAGARMRATRRRRYIVVVSGRFLCRRVPQRNGEKGRNDGISETSSPGGMKGNGMKEREGGGRGAESFATTSAERYYRR